LVAQKQEVVKSPNPLEWVGLVPKGKCQRGSVRTNGIPSRSRKKMRDKKTGLKKRTVFFIGLLEKKSYEVWETGRKAKRQKGYCIFGMVLE